MRLYRASTTTTGSAHRRGSVLTRATRPGKSMPAFGPVTGTCRCGADRPATVRARPWRDCATCTPARAPR